jgi:hypothetical protein
MTNKSKCKKATLFQKPHVLEFALEVVWTASNGDVTICWLFSLHEGRNVVEVGLAGRKHKQRGNIKYFTKSFAPFKYHSHHNGQHTSSWMEYQGLSIDKKKQYIVGRIKLTKTLHHHFDLDADTLQFSISFDIIETIVDNLFFHDNEQFDDIDHGQDD